MSCFNPKLMRAIVDPDTGVVTYSFVNEPGRFMDPSPVSLAEQLRDSVAFIHVPCGKCEGCRLDYTKLWSTRMVYEFEETKKAVFITLTYRDEDLPLADDGTPTLCKRDVQLWLKRLRKHLARKDITIRYYLCGEYGPKRERPHYHAILFGVSLNDIPDLVYLGANPELHYSSYTSPVWQDIWSHGYIKITDVTARVCDYVARYVLKKTKDVIDINDGDTLRIPPFNLSSRKPGIGFSRVESLVDAGLTQLTHVDASGDYTYALPSKALQRLEERYKKAGDLEKASVYHTLRQDIAESARQSLIAELNGRSYNEYLVDKRKERLRALGILPVRDFDSD